jgi:hypothetical protein
MHAQQVGLGGADRQAPVEDRTLKLFHRKHLGEGSCVSIIPACAVATPLLFVLSYKSLDQMRGPAHD